MRLYYDLHIHSCLSPCADNDMTPNNIFNMSVLNGLDIIALTDHNSSKNCRALITLSKNSDLLVIPGMELCTSEDIHILCLFYDIKDSENFSDFVYKNMLKIKNKPNIFGQQIIMDEFDQEKGQIENLLLTASNISIQDIKNILKVYNGVCIPAHIDRNSYSIISALGAIPKDLNFSCLESAKGSNILSLREKYKIQEIIKFIINSDAHNLGCIKFKDENSLFLDVKEKSINCVLDLFS